MARVLWPLNRGRPCVQVVLTLAQGRQALTRTLLADSGAGSKRSVFELVLDEDDCLLCGGNPEQPAALSGAYAGSFPTYNINVQIPALGFNRNLLAVGVSALPPGFDGIACFSFLRQFAYGNFANPDQFGLEC